MDCSYKLKFNAQKLKFDSIFFKSQELIQIQNLQNKGYNI